MRERQKPVGERLKTAGARSLSAASFVEQHEPTPALESPGHKQDMLHDLEV